MHQHHLHLSRGLWTDQVSDLPIDLAARRALPEEESSHRYGEQENRSEREYGVEGERRPDPGVVMLTPAVDGVLDERPDLPCTSADPSRNVEHTRHSATVVPQPSAPGAPTFARRPRFSGTLERHRGRHVRQMRESLWKVAQHLTELRLVLLREEAEIVGAAARPFEGLVRFLPPPLVRQALRQPERARHEDALG